MKVNYIENEYAEIWLESDLLYTVFKQNTILTVQVAEEVLKERLKVSNGKTNPMFVDLRNVITADNATRSYLATKSAQAFVSAGAFLINNEIHRLLMNLWLKIDKPYIPARAFTEKDKALQWLEQFKYPS